MACIRKTRRVMSNFDSDKEKQTIRLRANYAARVLHARDGENTHDEQLRIALQIKKDVMINR